MGRMALSRTASPAAAAAALARTVEPAPPEFPGCRAVRIDREAIADFEGRIEYWDAATETAWMVCEPTTVYHEGPGQRLAQLAALIAAGRGSPITTLGTADLLVRSDRGERQRIMQADQIVYLRPAETEPRGAAVEVGADHLPDVVLEVDHSTDVRRGKLGLYEAWGFPEVWVEVPDVGSPPRPTAGPPVRPDHPPARPGRLPPGGGERGVPGLDRGGDSRRPERGAAVGGDERGADPRRARPRRRRGHRARRPPVAARAGAGSEGSGKGGGKGGGKGSRRRRWKRSCRSFAAAGLPSRLASPRFLPVHRRPISSTTPSPAGTPRTSSSA